MIVNNVEHVDDRLHFRRGNEFEYNTIITIDGEEWLYNRDAIEPDTEDHSTASVEAISPNGGNRATIVWRSKYDDIEYDGWDYWFDWEQDLEKMTIYRWGDRERMAIILFDRSRRTYDRNCSASAFITPSGYFVSREDMESVADMLDFDIDEMPTDILAHVYGGSTVCWREGILNNEEGFLFEAI